MKFFYEENIISILGPFVIISYVYLCVYIYTHPDKPEWPEVINKW